MEFRKAVTADKEAVLLLMDQLGEEINNKIGFSPHNTEAVKKGSLMYQEVVSRKDAGVFLAVEDGEIIGLVSFYTFPNIRHGGYRGRIEDFVISKKARGKGVGSKLLQGLKDYFQQQNINVIKLDSGNELVEAHNFYRKNGGKQTEQMFRFEI